MKKGLEEFNKKYSNIFQKCFRAYHKHGIQEYKLFQDYFDIRDAELAPCKEKDAGKLGLYNYLKNHISNCYFYDMIFDRLEKECRKGLVRCLN